jgi:uncharacterized protein YlxW (UPF0749 family)
MISSALLVGGMALGVVIATQAQYQGLASASDQAALATTISRLEADQASLKTRIAELRADLDASQAAGTQGKTALSSTGSAEAQQLAAGTVALQGPGIVAVYDDSTVRSIPENEDPANYILHEYDLRDMLNSLWIAGAEAVSINGERIVGNSSLYCVGTTILVNTTRLSPPYEIHAIGDPEALSAALRTSPQMEKFNLRAQIYDLPVKIGTGTNVQVPAFGGEFGFRYSHIPGQK